MPKTSPAVQATPVAQAAINEVENQYGVIREQLRAVEAILDAAEVLSALERAPAHHDTHPSHGIFTGGAYAHGRRCADDTLPNLLLHAQGLVQMTRNDCDCLREYAISVLQNGGEAK
jgi:hypothetical protein